MLKEIDGSGPEAVKDNSSPRDQIIEIAEEPGKAAMEHAVQMVKTVTGSDDATVRRVLDDTGGDYIRAISRIWEMEDEVKVNAV